MKSICGADCNDCNYGKNNNCKGCKKSDGCPFGKECFIAKHIKIGGIDNYNNFKQQLIEELNSLNIPGIPKISKLYPLNGTIVNLEYRIPNGKTIKFLDDNSIYLGNQVECEFNDGEIIRYYGLVAGMDFLLICEYGDNGNNPELIVYKKR